MKLARIVIVWSLCIAASSATFGQSYTVSGTVRDAATNEVLPAAHIRIEETLKGTISNREGTFSLSLPSGPASLIVSFVGYRSDTLRLDVHENVRMDVRLVPVAIQFAEIVVTDEDPAYGIMRLVVENKHRWMNNLHSYEFEAFTRQILRKDTVIASITESYTTGYWRTGDTLREIIRQRRQTENIKVGQNFAAVGGIVNFYEDEIAFVGYRFVGPTAPDAFDYYRFKLIGTQEVSGVPFYSIQMTPRSTLTPLFSGTLSVAGDRYALVGLDVVPNEAFVVPFVPDAQVRYAQQFGLYDQKFWMPVDIRITGRFEVEITGFSLPPIGFEQTSSIFNYRINAEVPDSVFKKSRIIRTKESEVFDSTYWAEHEVLPLTVEENAAYKTLDSTQSLEKQFKPGGALSALDSPILEAFEYVDARYNRVEGGFLGGKISFDSTASWLSLHARAGYGFADDRAKYEGGFEAFLDGARHYSIGVNAYNQVRAFHDETGLGFLGASSFALFVKNDPLDYYYVAGFSVIAKTQLARTIGVSLSYVDEQHVNAPQTSDYSFFNKSKSFRENPQIIEGRLRSVGAEVRFGGEEIPLNLVARDFGEIVFEAAPQNFLGGDFKFTQIQFRGEVHIPTFLRRNLFPPTLSMHLAAGASGGSVPIQKMFSVPSQVSAYAPFGVLRGAGVKEFTGEHYAMLSLEQNFRSLPFQAIGLSYLHKHAIDFLIGGSIARSWASDAVPPLYDRPTKGWYAEAGFGISRIFSFFRIDGTYRFSSPSRFVVTFSFARLI